MVLAGVDKPRSSAYPQGALADRASYQHPESPFGPAADKVGWAEKGFSDAPGSLLIKM